MDWEHDFLGALEDFQCLHIGESSTLDLNKDSKVEFSKVAFLELLASDFVLCKVSSGSYPEELPPVSDLVFVFDLNGTLMYEERYYSKYKKAYVKKLTLRDYCRELLDTVFRYFRVAVWSSAVWKNTRFRCRFAFGDYYDHLLFVWSRRQCTEKISSASSFATKKDLERIWVQFPGTSAKNTVIIDDDAYKVESYARNCIVVDPIAREHKKFGKEDRTLLKLSWYIEYLHLGMSCVPDVRVIMDVLPFRRFLQLIEWFSPRAL
ncbi:hypothetical protein GAYE_SCF31G4883 [Galdieria yellowstonensis]|uniref:Mitochondrial import inner membrane translocase subunit TIM50 n=1 Tax=Galdieria yellowstonensis TaxID=3028027 RepID=A0AAV9IHL8_9RHOD|nr:hypothetical protein GAYE_SCF31G4883 [Galdieria yellowstonensis]